MAIAIEISGRVPSEINRKSILEIAKKHLLEKIKKDISFELIFAENSKIRELNKSFRSKDSPTNVLSFPLDQIPGESQESKTMIGTIFVSSDIIKSEATQNGVSFKDEFNKLLTHGLDHLIGIHHD